MRAEAFKDGVEKVGGKFVNGYYTFRKILEAPNDEAIASVLLQVLGMYVVKHLRYFRCRK
jgi:uncharacterized protein with GYD domain